MSAAEEWPEFEQGAFFEVRPKARAWRPLPFSPYPHTEIRTRAKPTYSSRIPKGTDIAPALWAAELRGLPLFPQGELVAATILATNAHATPLYETVVVLMPRRSTKTTSILSTLAGRCRAIPGYQIASTAQDGLRARNILRGLMRELEANGFEGKGLGRLYWSNGHERIEWSNGSSWWVVPPEASAFRSAAADALLFEEAGELSAEESEELVAGALPLTDTRPMGQVIITGTPSALRAGLLWDTLQDARAKRDRTLGIVDYSIRDTEQGYTIDPDTGVPILNERILRRVHPGIGTEKDFREGKALTTMRVMRKRFEKLGPVKFETEYMCRFPFDQTTSAIDPKKWAAGRVLDPDGKPAALPVRPDRVGLAFDVAPDGSSAALVAAWRDEDGHAYGEVVAYRPGTTWLPEVARTAYRKHRTPIAHDTIGANVDPADTMHRARVRLAPLNLRAMQGAAQRLVAELTRDRLHHYGQPDLDRAAEGAAWRNAGTEGGRLFGRKASANDVSPLVAYSAALWQYDQQTRRRTTGVTSTT